MGVALKIAVEGTQRGNKMALMPPFGYTPRKLNKRMTSPSFNLGSDNGFSLKLLVKMVPLYNE